MLSMSRDIMQFMKRLESLLKIAGMKFEFKNLEIRFHKRQISFLVVKTDKCKRSIKGALNPNFLNLTTNRENIALDTF